MAALTTAAGVENAMTCALCIVVDIVVDVVVDLGVDADSGTSRVGFELAITAVLAISTREDVELSGAGASRDGTEEAITAVLSINVVGSKRKLVFAVDVEELDGTAAIDGEDVLLTVSGTAVAETVGVAGDGGGLAGVEVVEEIDVVVETIGATALLAAVKAMGGS